MKGEVVREREGRGGRDREEGVRVGLWGRKGELCLCAYIDMLMIIELVIVYIYDSNMVLLLTPANNN